ncbi:HYR domain-containing protein [Lysobacter sp. CFH 32150]|uniref:HYR domain-containing protein n=1 Tax=Lysobacter sp. CFH 32150 TaxID=2927128 RepID=UPI001FA72261|nr:HYR domain-containing protein [Lysobacter sp. CFH 32150]MCI4566705.1 HYR domain-containing protein [Lysobacter sp. CFH 32150]
MKLTTTAQGRRWLVAITSAIAFAAATPVFAQQSQNQQCGQHQGADIQGGAVRANVPDFDAVAGGGYVPHVETFTTGGSSKPSAGPGVTYSWSQGAGETAGTFSATTGTSTLFTVPDVGPAGEELTVTLTITSTLSSCPGVWTDTVRVQVIDFYTVVANVAPIAVATATPDTVDEGVPVTLSAAGSNDPDGDPLTYSWVQTDGVPVSLAGANTDTATFTAPNTAYPSGDTLQFELTVSDGTFSDVAPVTVNVTWVNDSPVAALSCPPSVNERANLYLDGSASSDGDDGIASYVWTGGWSTLDLSGYTANAINVEAKTLGFHEWPFFTFTLTTTDASGAYTFEDCMVEILDVTAPEIVVPQAAIAGDPDIVQEADSAAGAEILYELQVSAMDNFDGHLNYGSASFACAPASGTVFPLGSAPAQGTTTEVTCTATDSAGNSSNASFDVRVQDTTAPAITVPASIAVEAIGPDGAPVDYGVVPTLDAVDGAGTAVCTPASGTVFQVGVTQVDCEAEDARGNNGTASFEVAVHDTTPPEITVPDPITAEATSAQGAPVTFSVSAFDLVDEVVAVTCDKQSGDTFPLGTTTVQCSAHDSAVRLGFPDGNVATASFTVTVVDTTPPDLSLPGNMIEEATSSGGAVVTFVATADDLVDGNVAVTCVPASGSLFALGVTPVNCSATDAAGNTATGSFNITVQDTTPPALTLPANPVVEATSAAGAVVNFVASALDIVDGNVSVTCVPTSGSTFALAPAPTKANITAVDCSATDAAGNTAHGSFNVTVQDTTAPSIDQPADIGPIDATGPDGAIATFDNPATHDVVDGDGVADCDHTSGTLFPLGTTTVTCTATDARGNAATPVTFTVTVHYPWNGFFRPIDNLPTVNSAKAGSAIPVKFNLGGNMGLAIFAQGYPRVVLMQCTSGALEDVIEETVTAGSSTLTYDAAAQQYIYVWKSDKLWAGSCRQLQLKLADGTVHAANFKFTK